MFAKPYKLRATNTLKNSEKKSLVQRIQDEFPSISEAQAKELVPVKCNAVWLRLLLHSGQPAAVLVVDSTPMLIELEDELLIPTVCALWKVPNMVPVITVYEPVLTKVAGGAPLYVPGVVTGSLPEFPRGAVVAARTADNAAAALIARASISSGDLFLRAKYDSSSYIPPSMNRIKTKRYHGPCVDILHVYGDQLCRDKKFTKIQRPALTSDTDIVQGLEKMKLPEVEREREQWPVVGEPAFGVARSVVARPVISRAPAPARPATANAVLTARQPPVIPEEPVLTAHQPIVIPDKPKSEGDHPNVQELAETDIKETEESTEPESPSKADDCVPVDMAARLRWALLVFIKLQAKHVTLPLKTNLLYKNYLMALCPPEKPLDVKKTSYKKVSKFLEAMKQEGLVELKEEEKGVWSVTALNGAHPAVVSVALPPPASRPRAPAPPRDDDLMDYEPPLIRELFCITAAAAPFFPEHKKGTGVTGAEVRAAAAAYVRARGLASGPGRVTLDGPLAGLLGGKEGETVSWEAVGTGLRLRMTAAAEVRLRGHPARLLKRALPPVTMSVASRAGNKKVTLVSNLETYGFDLPSLCRSWQALASAACGVTRTPAAATDQILLQGDQTYFVAKTLIEKYHLPKKYVEGADKALAKKKR